MYRPKFGFDITDVFLWFFVYSVIAFVVEDVFKTIEYGKRARWVLGVLCMPALAIPVYAVISGKRSS